LAIEQLTGAATAGQAALSGEANASAASALRTTQEMLNKANEDLEAARQAKTKADDQVKTTEQQITALGDPGADESKKAEKTRLDEQLIRDKEEAGRKAQDVKVAEESKKVIERNRDAAFAQANAAASGKAVITGGHNGGLSGDSTGHVANAVERIVATVMGKNHLVDNCLNFLIRPPQQRSGRDAEASPKEVNVAIAKARNDMAVLCSDVMRADIDMRKRSNTAQALAYENYYKGPLPRPKPDQPPSPDKLTPPPSGVY
jgi:hypothetical protein